jgi:hypothetical protein
MRLSLALGRIGNGGKISLFRSLACGLGKRRFGACGGSGALERLGPHLGRRLQPLQAEYAEINVRRTRA